MGPSLWPPNSFSADAVEWVWRDGFAGLPGQRDETAFERASTNVPSQATIVILLRALETERGLLLGQGKLRLQR